jgi:hypothetical protein
MNLTGVTASDPPGQSLVQFDWQADPTAGVTRYDLEIGTAPGLKDVAVINVALTTSFVTMLPHKTYWFRVRSWIGAVAGAVTPDMQIIVTNRLGRVSVGSAAALHGVSATVQQGFALPLPATPPVTAIPILASTAIGTLKASVTTGTTGPHITVDEWPVSVTVGSRGRVLIRITHTAPVTLLQVQLGTQVIAEVSGGGSTDMRDMAGLYFAVPRTPGTYQMTVRAVDKFKMETVTPSQAVTITP